MFTASDWTLESEKLNVDSDYIPDFTYYIYIYSKKGRELNQTASQENLIYKCI